MLEGTIKTHPDTLSLIAIHSGEPRCTSLDSKMDQTRTIDDESVKNEILKERMRIDESACHFQAKREQTSITSNEI